jgi:hypothetical protein
MLQSISHTLDFLMPQYYNGFTRSAVDGFHNSGMGRLATSVHSSAVLDMLFGGDATRIVFGFCISDCGGTESNANASQAAAVMTEVGESYNCNGGAFFWVAEHDFGGSWSSIVNTAIDKNRGCSGSPVSPVSVPAATESPNQAPTRSSAPVVSLVTPAPTSGPTVAPMSTSAPVTPVPTNGPTFAPTPTRAVIPEPTSGPTFVPTQAAATPVPTESQTSAPTLAPMTLKPEPTLSPVTTPAKQCCPNGFSGWRAFDACTKFYQCAYGQVVGVTHSCVEGMMFDASIQNCNWDFAVKKCQVDPCGV